MSLGIIKITVHFQVRTTIFVHSIPISSLLLSRIFSPQHVYYRVLALTQGQNGSSCFAPTFSGTINDVTKSALVHFGGGVVFSHLVMRKNLLLPLRICLHMFIIAQVGHCGMRNSNFEAQTPLIISSVMPGASAHTVKVNQCD